MKNKAYNLKSYSFTSGEKILFDANIWLYLFPPPGDPKDYYACQYSKAFKKLLDARAKPVLSPIVMSEYLNRYCRIEWIGYYKKKFPVFKQFRKSQDFQQISGTASKFAKRILTMSELCSSTIEKEAFEKSLDDFADGDIDFNDTLLIDACKQENLKLLTNDSDFNNGGIEVLTTNPTLLKYCSS